MGHHAKVVNVTTGFRMKRKEALEAIEACSAVWVTEGLTVRSLAPAEAIRARNLQARSRIETIIPETVFVRTPTIVLEPFAGSWVDEKGRCADKRKSQSCEICGDVCKTVFDHCHKTEIFRGWLCGRCNSMLGFARDNPQTLRNAANYLENFTEKIKCEATTINGVSLPSGQFEQRIQVEAQQGYSSN